MTHAMETLRPHWAAAAARSPLTAYLCATAEDLPAWASETVPHLLCLPATKLHQYDSAMETAPATQFHRLLTHYEACCAAVAAELEKLKKELSKPAPPHSSTGNVFGSSAFGSSGFGSSGFGSSAFTHPGANPFGGSGQQRSTQSPPDSKYFVVTFLDNLANSTVTGPGGKVVKAKTILRESDDSPRVIDQLVKEVGRCNENGGS
ncbi:hypothetical protein C8Q80DRAFT_244537 [Daedaleopsis nitida]|nr:hypothetical protein C8Q80DRAFT_244537 [Daedaleopsis nitida]